MDCWIHVLYMRCKLLCYFGIWKLIKTGFVRLGRSFYLVSKANQNCDLKGPPVLGYKVLCSQSEIWCGVSFVSQQGLQEFVRRSNIFQHSYLAT
jgi:hypothetical protein